MENVNKEEQLKTFKKLAIAGVAVISVVVGYKIGYANCRHLTNLGLAKCFEIDPTYRDHTYNVLAEAKKRKS